ncbi:MAG TPA: CaiB/BaiF CoA-transferase family protein [Candidatus Latescibacteria bacterium]|nr:CaiB/BaiF CoA-transferase family protein [Candidatus Latescibacterota bacterium]
MNDKPLRGVRVLDLSRLLPGPYGTLLLADLGAEVIKVEDVESGDYIRAMGPSIGGQSAYFLALNPGKKSVALNLKAPAGREIFLKLAATAGVVVEGFRPGTAKRLGIGYEAVKAVNPRIVYCSISGYGQDGPDRDRAGHDLNYIARAGILGLCGRPGAAPTIPPVQVADLSSAMYAAVGILAYLRESERTGEGRYLDIGMLDSALSWMVMPVAEYAAGERGGRGRLPLTGKHPCYNVYRTRDGRDVCLAALEKKFWEAFCRATGREDLLSLQFSERPEDFARLETLFSGRTRDEWAALLKDSDFCCELVPDLDEVLSNPQVMRRGLVIEAAEDGQSYSLLGHPLRDRADQGRPACPGHGEHTAEVLRGLGVSDGELAELEAAGVVRGRPR